MNKRSTRFDGQVAIVTGAGSNPGLGRTYARLLAAHGAKVVVNDIGVGSDGRGQVGTGVETVAEEIRQDGGTAIVDRNSVADRESASRIVQTALDEWGRIDILINNAGIAPFALFRELSDQDIQRVVDVHLMGHIWMCRAVWPHMMNQSYGRIVNVSSSVGFLGIPYQAVYSAAKFGVIGLTRCLASEGLRAGIKVNAIMPHATTLAWQTMVDARFSEQERHAGQVPEVVAPVAAWLAHKECSVSGKCFQTGGGSVSEIFFSKTKGSPDNSELKISDVHDIVMYGLNHGQSTEYPDPDGTLPENLVPKPYVP